MGGGDRLYTPLQRIRQTLINWEECKQAAKTQDSAGWRSQSRGRMWGEERERRKGRRHPLAPLCLVNSPPRRLIPNLPEQYGGGPWTWRPYGLQTALQLLTMTSIERPVVEAVAEPSSQKTFILIWFVNINNLQVFPNPRFYPFTPSFLFLPLHPIIPHVNKAERRGVEEGGTVPVRTNDDRFNRLVSVKLRRWEQKLLRMSGVQAPIVALFANGSTFSQHFTTVCKPSDPQMSEDLRGSRSVGGPTSCRFR